MSKWHDAEDLRRQLQEQNVELMVLEHFFEAYREKLAMEFMVAQDMNVHQAKIYAEQHCKSMRISIAAELTGKYRRRDEMMQAAKLSIHPNSFVTDILANQKVK